MLYPAGADRYNPATMRFRHNMIRRLRLAALVLTWSLASFAPVAVAAASNGAASTTDAWYLDLGLGVGGPSLLALLGMDEEAAAEFPDWLAGWVERGFAER